ncbi:hypothetical protein JXJ21_25240 [candidate division KSB1 bacterium]|nr:hypothetical protein [candidate division KSB1 bacterium]
MEITSYYFIHSAQSLVVDNKRFFFRLLWFSIFLLFLFTLLQCNPKSPLEGARPVLEKITISGDGEGKNIFIISETFQFNARGYFQNEAEQEITNSVEWVSLDTALAVIDRSSGIATFKKAGQNTIIAESRGAEGRIIQGRLAVDIAEMCNIPLDGYPVDLAADSNFALVLSRANSVYSFHLPGDSLFDCNQIQHISIPLKSKPSQVAIGDNSKRAFICRQGKEITVLNLEYLPEKLENMCEPDLEWQPTSVFSSNYLNKAYFTISYLKRVSEVSSDCDKKDYDFAYTPNDAKRMVGTDSLILINNSDPRLWLYDLSDNQSIEFEVDSDFDHPSALVTHPTKPKIYILSSSAVYMVSALETSGARRVADLPASPGYMVIDAKGTRAYIGSDDNNFLYAFNVTTDQLGNAFNRNSEHSFIPYLENPTQMAISGNSNFGYILDEKQKIIYKANCSENRLIRKIALPYSPYKMSLAKNGKSLMIIHLNDMYVTLMPAF